jgi:MFS family permease
MLNIAEIAALRSLTYDGRLLFMTRMVRLFSYGALSVILALYLAQIGFNEQAIGLLLTASMLGDAALSLWIVSIADRVGRRRMLLVGAGLIVFAGLVFALTSNIVLLAIAAIIGTMSPTGSEVGPFYSIEQAALPQTTSDTHRTAVFAWYHLAGSFATALGALSGGTLAGVLQHAGYTPQDSYRAIILGYGLLGILLGGLFVCLSSAIEVPHHEQRSSESLNRRQFGLQRSRGVVLKLAVLFMLDAFAGGLVVQSFVAYWLNLRFGVEPAVLGGIFFGASSLSGLSALAAARIAARVGLVNTMVWTHIPSNILLILVPLMPNLQLAIAVLLARFSISQMDVPTRQSYMMAVIDPDERSAAAGITTIARTAASAAGPVFTGFMLSAALFSLPFFAAGGLKIIYDLALYRNFKALKPPEENTSPVS